MSQQRSADTKSDGESTGLGWKVATGILALATIIAVIWGVTRSNDLQSQIDELQGTVTTQQETGETAASVTSAQIADLEKQNAELKKALDATQKYSKAVLDGAASEYSALEAQLKKSEEALAQLQKDQEANSASAEEIAAAYADAQSELQATQEALVSLLEAIAEDLEGESAQS